MDRKDNKTKKTERQKEKTEYNKDKKRKWTGKTRTLKCLLKVDREREQI
jgi:hypothetical protein